jgi:DNA-binding NtrC family response regulator
MKPEIHARGERPLRILVVEDEPLIRLLVADCLRDEGITVIEAATADEAWNILATELAVDLIFTDHRMPGTMTGLELAAKVKAQYPNLPVVMMSGACDGRGFSGKLFQKPYPILEVVDELRQLAIATRGLN